jgi:hypothetical protein
MKYGERMLAQLSKDSPAYSIINNGVIIASWPTGMQLVMRIFCTNSDADIVIEAAKTLCPDALPEIEKSLQLFPFREL